MGKEKIEEKDVRLLRYAVEQAFDGAMRDGALALLNRLVDSASEAANLEEANGEGADALRRRQAGHVR